LEIDELLAAVEPDHIPFLPEHRDHLLPATVRNILDYSERVQSGSRHHHA
jgi:hypothetical protein